MSGVKFDNPVLLMYTDVHMVQVVSITDLRKNLFQLANKVIDKGEEIEVEKDGRRLLKLVKIDDDPRERARKALKLLPKLGGMWKDIPDENFKELDEFFRGKKEKRYMKKLGKWTENT